MGYGVGTNSNPTGGRGGGDGSAIGGYECVIYGFFTKGGSFVTVGLDFRIIKERSSREVISGFLQTFKFLLS